MGEVTVTRGSQITLTEDVREKMGVEEGDVVTVNAIQDQAMVTKKDPEAWETSGFLPDDFDEMLDEMRSGTEDRMERILAR